MYTRYASRGTRRKCGEFKLRICIVTYLYHIFTYIYIFTYIE